MDMKLKEKFIESWKKYFDGAELPITFYYADDPGGVEIVPPTEGWSCLVAELNKVRAGRSLALSTESIGCFGGKRFLGFSHELTDGFEYFLSHGIPGKIEGERYKKTPELVKKFTGHTPDFDAPGKYVIFKRWDALEQGDEPDAAIFYAKADVLSGLFTLAGFDEEEPSAVYAPFSPGCGSIVLHPYMENKKERPKCIIGMFDVSARPCVQPDVLTFSVPMKKIASMVADMDESFLITPSWDKVKKRIAKAAEK